MTRPARGAYERYGFEGTRVVPANIALRPTAKRYASSNGIPARFAASLSWPSNTAK